MTDLWGHDETLRRRPAAEILMPRAGDVVARVAAGGLNKRSATQLECIMQRDAKLLAKSVAELVENG